MFIIFTGLIINSSWKLLQRWELFTSVNGCTSYTLYIMCSPCLISIRWHSKLNGTQWGQMTSLQRGVQRPWKKQDGFWVLIFRPQEKDTITALICSSNFTVTPKDLVILMSWQYLVWFVDGIEFITCDVSALCVSLKTTRKWTRWCQKSNFLFRIYKFLLK